MSPGEERVFREVERQVLDQHHRQFDLLHRGESIAIQAILRRYALIVRHLRSGYIEKPSDAAKTQTANEGLRGLAHCLRWIRKCCPSRILVSTPPPDVLENEALDLLRWGVSYDPLYNQHTAFSRRISGNRLVEATIDEAHNVISFLAKSEVDPRFFVSQVEAKKAVDERETQKYPEQQLSELSKAWYDSASPSGHACGG